MGRIVFTVIERARAAGARLRGESGQGLVEYALIIAIVSLGAIAALTFLKGNIAGLFSKAGNSINAVAVGADGSGGGGPTPPAGPTPGAVVITQPDSSHTGSNPSFTMTATNSGWTGVAAGNSYSYVWQQGNVSPTGAPTNCAGVTWSAFAGPVGAGTTNGQPPQDPSGNGNDGDRCYRVTVTATATGGGTTAITSAAFFVNNV